MFTSPIKIGAFETLFWLIAQNTQNTLSNCQRKNLRLPELMSESPSSVVVDRSKIKVKNASLAFAEMICPDIFGSKANRFIYPVLPCFLFFRIKDPLKNDFF